MDVRVPTYCGTEALDRLIRDCRSRQPERYLLVADENTYTALGRRVKAVLEGQEWDVRTVVLQGADVHADERRVFEVLYHAEGGEFLYMAVGSGTVTDIARCASYCSRNAFVSLPTAASVDGYTSEGAALTVGGFKMTIRSQTPLAIYADLATLRAAPRQLTASGFGDMLGKCTALADWKLGALLMDEPYHSETAGRARRALLTCVEQAREIGQNSAQGIGRLMEALFESGLCMVQAGTSRPASGSEHLLSHFWEMSRLQGGRPALLHGAKVGIATVLTARRYAAIRGLTREEAAGRLAATSLPGQEGELGRIRTAFGPLADRVAVQYRPFLEALESGLEALKQRIADRWAEVQEIAASVPSAEAIAGLLQQVGGPDDPCAVGLGEDEVRQALAFSHYLRGRFTVDTLGRLLGLW